MLTDRAPSRIRKATTADCDAIERNVNAVCQEGIYLVPSRFVTPPIWRKILAVGGELDDDLIVVAEVNTRVVGQGVLKEQRCIGEQYSSTWMRS